MSEEAEEAEEEEESEGRNVREHSSGGETRRGSSSEVDSPLQIQWTERDRGSRESVLRGIPVPGKGKGTIADVRRNLSGGRSRRPAGLVRRSMPAQIEREHAVVHRPLQPNSKHGCRYA